MGWNRVDTAAYTLWKIYAAVFDLEKRKLELLMSVVLILCAWIFAEKGWEKVSADRVESGPARWTVVIDAGHGGNDPGKIGVDDSQEKDLNLIIAKKVQKLLEQQDVEVVMTRESDAGLYDENASNKKVQDMKNRVALIEERQPALTVSIHQNSYHEEYVHGAQVFYYANSEKSKTLAERIQQAMALELDKENARQAKANDSYYLLKKTSTPIVIVECGFLSNYEEAQKLASDLYQEKVAWAIHMAVMQYLNQEDM